MKKPKNFDFITEPYPFQLEVFAFGVARPNAGLLLDLGLGKTKSAIDLARYRIKFNNVRRIWVVVPATILYNWKSQIELHSEYKGFVIAAQGDERMYRALSSDYHFNIINYEALFPLLRDLGIFEKVKTKKGKRIFFGNTSIEKIKKYLPQYIIFDESARYISSPDTDRTLASIALADQASFKNILTGTPIRNKAMGIWSQFRVLDGGKTFSDNFYKFRNFFFFKDDTVPFGKYTLIEKKIPILTKGIYDSCIRFKKEDVLKDLPPKIFHSIKLKMSPELEKIYTSVKKQILSEIATKGGSTTLSVTNILTRLLRLQQVTSGFIPDKKKGEYVELRETPKLDALVEEVMTILDAEESVVIWCRFLKSIDMISKRLGQYGIAHTTMSGEDTNKEARYKKWKNFQESKLIDVFVGQITSGGIGIELFKFDSIPDKSQHMVFYENTWTMDDRDQAIGRIHRIGQKSVCRYIDIIVMNTIDEKILTCVSENKRIADAIVEGGLEKFLKAA